MRIKIDIEEDIKSFVITGDIANVIKNRGSYIFLKSNFHAKFFVNKIVIEYVDDKREELLNRIRRFFKHNGLEEETSTNIKDVLQKYFKEEENFKNFSKRALNIRNNITDSKEFAEFTNVLKKQMRNRKLYPLQLLQPTTWLFLKTHATFLFQVLVRHP